MATTGELLSAALKGLDLAGGKKKSLPPVEKWNPPSCGDIGMKIARDGVWFYQGSPIGRLKMVQLFSTILRRDEDGFYLVTPVEKVPVDVEDAPFMAVLMRVEGKGEAQKLFFTTNVGDEVCAGEDHAIRCEINKTTGEPAPYIHIRRGLEAKIARAIFYDMVALGEEKPHQGQPYFGVCSQGQFFPLAPAGDLA